MIHKIFEKTHYPFESAPALFKSAEGHLAHKEVSNQPDEETDYQSNDNCR